MIAIYEDMQMLEVKFYKEADDNLLKFAVIATRSNGKWVFCKHKDRDTYECPGGHREEGESIVDTARRELWEETGAIDFSLCPVCVYSVSDENRETFGMLYYSEINVLGKLPELEIEKIELFDDLPEKWTYPAIQPKLIEKVNRIVIRN
jgi:8-oxo-dGTP diphosphatase